MTKSPVKIAITGAAGNISYALLFRIAAGEFIGKDQPVILQLLEITPALNALKGVIMELDDCTFPLLHGVHATDQAEEAFADIDYAFLVGARPRSQGMERKDLLQANAAIFSAQGKALNKVAKKTVKVLVVGNPANTNALIAQNNAPDIAPGQFTAMTRLDHNRAITQVAQKAGTSIHAIKHMTIWGNHSATQFPDLYHSLIDDRPALERIDESWYQDTFIPMIQQRGAAVIKARGASSAASAANAALDHMRTWALGCPAGDWVSMGLYSEGAYGITQGLIYSFPVHCHAGTCQPVTGLEINAFSTDQLKQTEQELLEERDAIRHLLP